MRAYTRAQAAKLHDCSSSPFKQLLRVIFQKLLERLEHRVAVFVQRKPKRVSHACYSDSSISTHTHTHTHTQSLKPLFLPPPPKKKEACTRAPGTYASRLFSINTAINCASSPAEKEGRSGGLQTSTSVCDWWKHFGHGALNKRACG